MCTRAVDWSRGLSLGFLSAALFGVATPLSKDLLSEISPTVLAGLLYLGAATALAPFVMRPGLRSSMPKDGANRRRLAGAALFGGVAGPVLLLFGLQLSALPCVGTTER